MKNLLINLYYDGYGLDEAIEFIERCYQESPSQKVIAKVKDVISETTGKNWN